MFSSAAMRAVVDDRARLQRMLDFEAALARAEAAVGVIPHEAVDPIAGAAKAERYDIAALTSLIHEDATQSMPPFELWLQGAENIGAWMVEPGPDACGTAQRPPDA